MSGSKDIILENLIKIQNDCILRNMYNILIIKYDINDISSELIRLCSFDNILDNKNVELSRLGYYKDIDGKVKCFSCKRIAPEVFDINDEGYHTKKYSCDRLLYNKPVAVAFGNSLSGVNRNLSKDTKTIFNNTKTGYNDRLNSLKFFDIDDIKTVAKKGYYLYVDDYNITYILCFSCGKEYPNHHKTCSYEYDCLINDRYPEFGILSKRLDSLKEKNIKKSYLWACKGFYLEGENKVCFSCGYVCNKDNVMDNEHFEDCRYKNVNIIDIILSSPEYSKFKTYLSRLESFKGSSIENKEELARCGFFGVKYYLNGGVKMFNVVSCYYCGKDLLWNPDLNDPKSIQLGPKFNNCDFVKYVLKN